MFGSLLNFSLGELFRVLEQGHKTGRLHVSGCRSEPDQQELVPELCTKEDHYIWFRHGAIVAASNTLDSRGLLRLIKKRSWVADYKNLLKPGFCNVNLPLGICLKSHGLVTAEQLKLLFAVQVLRQVCQLFMLLEGDYYFEEAAQLSYAEMTGLSSSATDVTLAGLRNLKDWSRLEDKLPDADSALLSIVDGQGHVKLNRSELRVWEFADGTVSLRDIAARLDFSVAKVRQIAFRLSMINLADEFPLLVSASDMLDFETGFELDEMFIKPDLDGSGLESLEHLSGDRPPSTVPSTSTPQEIATPPSVSEDFLQELMQTLNNS